MKDQAWEMVLWLWGFYIVFCAWVDGQKPWVCTLIFVGTVAVNQILVRLRRVSE